MRVCSSDYKQLFQLLLGISVCHSDIHLQGSVEAK